MNKQEFTLRSDLEKARASALASLCMREHAIKELTDKLIRKEYKIKSITIVIAECLKDNYLNDARFSEVYWRSRARKGFGPQKIQLELQQKGIDSHTIEISRNQDDLDFNKIIARVYYKKFKGIEITSFEDKIKRQNYLYQRGFDSELIRSIL